ncbi:MAG: type 4a pilus biogenesis protein PilO [Bdellovibrionales bacterium]|jgi:Tfp pilus assembly protein PilO|nr:type 4a pilus biogenesis protein PilO [Bdellovibrionales bacterium]MBT7670521.1 type 4a pilus biogenesis protein PilO [Bdellovibrionales bacterium]
MPKHLEKIISNLHWILLLWVIFHHYSLWEVYQLKVDSVKAKKSTVLSKIKRLEKKKEQMSDFLANVEAAKDRVKTVTKQVEHLQKQLPIEVSDTENLHIISTLAKSLNIQNIFLAPKTEKLHGFYYSRIYEFKARGTFLQFLVLLEGISNSTRVFNIRNMKLEKDKKKQKGRFQLVEGTVAIEAYRQNRSYHEDSGIEAIEKKYSAESDSKKKKNKRKNKKRRGKRKKRRRK